MKLPFNLQFFAEGDAGAAGAAAGQPGQQTTQQGSSQTAGQDVDYGKIQQMLDGTLRAKEDTALKAYFKQQGLSQEEAEQAIMTFKQQKAANQPDVTTLQTQMSQVQETAQRAVIEKEAVLTAVELGIEVKTIPYVLKMADLGEVMGQDSKLNNEKLKSAMSKVLEDVPALKPAAGQSTGFVQVGVSGQDNAPGTTDAELDRIFGTKK